MLLDHSVLRAPSRHVLRVDFGVTEKDVLCATMTTTMGDVFQKVAAEAFR